jgi:hypothetical protein
VDQYTPELLKELEEIILSKSEEIYQDSLGDDIWGSVKHPWIALKFLSYIDYSSSRLLKVYSEFLKDGKPARYGKYHKTLNKIKGVKRGLDFEALSKMLQLCKALLISQNRLPLHLNNGSMFNRVIVKWRIMKGV